MFWRTTAFYALAVLTALALGLFAANLAPSPDARMFYGDIGGALLVLLAPFWLVYRGRVPLLAALVGVALVVCGVIAADCEAARAIGTSFTHPRDYVTELALLAPGAAYAVARSLFARARRRPPS